MLFKKQDRILQTLTAAGRNLAKASIHFKTAIIHSTFRGPEHRELEDSRLQGTQYSYTIVNELNKTFIPPLERDDILSLTFKIQDTLEQMETSLVFMELYCNEPLDKSWARFGDIINICCNEIEKSLVKLAAREHLAARRHPLKIYQLYEEAQTMLLTYLRVKESLVTHSNSKEIYHSMKDLMIKIRDAGRALEMALIKNC